VIGVLSKENEAKVVEEFFQLFKTPWEFYIQDHSYDCVIATSEDIPEHLNAELLVIYHSDAIAFDHRADANVQSRGRCDWIEWRGTELPIYGDLAVLGLDGEPFVQRKATGEPVAIDIEGLEQPAVRIGYDLFYEVEFLLSQGQPAENARIPTLDTHISLLRAIIVSRGVPIVEIPPTPAGYDFMACLTHDVDFVGIRDHKCDHTMWGFIYRCLVASPLQALRGRFSWSKCRQNMVAAASLPLVHLAFLDDFWLEFERYMEIEKESRSTFFFLPFKNVPGTLNNTTAPKRRGGKYDVREMKTQLLALLDRGFEVGLHGIDAWHNSESARAELRRIGDLTGQADLGVRMHWLYWKDKSPRVLEDAEVEYDSTFGYNDAIGFRAGTAQPFCPMIAQRLLELTLNIQDSAMFYSDRMKLSDAGALEACRALIHSMTLFGGVLTVNWHTRSLSPERLWGDFYTKLLGEIRAHRVWFGTARDVVAWFRKRRALLFGPVQFGLGRVNVALSGAVKDSAPAFTVRVHYPMHVRDKSGAIRCTPAFMDAQWNGEESLVVPYASAQPDFSTEWLPVKGYL
jgi:hypothetical protein